MDQLIIGIIIGVVAGGVFFGFITLKVKWAAEAQAERLTEALAGKRYPIASTGSC